ncbi:MAG: hypothetical protein LIO39_05610 [Lachnospiraceae bacterium]|nr:hypothetical protein [Lachnospiraceae bacterium]
MRENAIVIGGFEPSYMRKLALYLTSRLGAQIQVGLADDPQAVRSDEDHVVWVGSEAFLAQLREREEAPQCILLSENREEEDAVWRYQSCEKLYQGIMTRYRQMNRVMPVAAARTKQKWIAVTSDQGMPALLVFSLVCAQILGEKEGVLYLNFSECCGMERLFLLESGADLTDLFAEAAADRPLCLDACVRKLEQTDYILPPANPMVLHELRETDIGRLIQAVERRSEYEYVVVAVGTSCCGCEAFFRRASRIFHLTGEDLLSGCCREDWTELTRLCVGDDGRAAEPVYLREVRADLPGLHLIHEWIGGEVGQQVRRYLDM